MSYGFGCAMVMFVSPNNFMCGFGTRDYFSKGIYPDKNQKKKNKKFMCCILPLKGIPPVNPIFVSTYPNFSYSIFNILVFCIFIIKTKIFYASKSVMAIHILQ